MKLSKQIKIIILGLILCLVPGLSSCTGEVEQRNDFKEGWNYLEKMDYLEAERSFERYLRHNPDGENRWEAWNQLVNMAVNIRSSRKSAIDLLEVMRIEYQNNPERLVIINNMLAGQYELAHMYPQALELWNEVVAAPQADVNMKAEIYRNLARLYLRRMEFSMTKEALAYCLELKGVNEKIASMCHYDLADAYLIMEDIDAGIKELNLLLEQENFDSDLRILAVFMLADAYEQKGEKARALSLFEGIRNSYPNSQVINARIEYLQKN